LRSILSTTPHEVTIDVATANALFEQLQSGTPCDLILLDILLPETSGVEVAQRLRAEYPNIKIIVVSMETKEYTLIQLMQIGIDGFISKNGPMEEVCAAINSVEEGVPYYGHDLALLVRDIVDARLDKKSSALLTKRELEIIEACCSGMLGKEIAEKYGIKYPSLIANWRTRLLKPRVYLRKSEKSSTFAPEIKPQVADEVPMKKRSAEELEAENKKLSKDLEWAELQIKALNTLIDIAEEQGIRIRKKSGAKQ
jgi:DNA-binding NarL/FixJ family response regulator